MESYTRAPKDTKVLKLGILYIEARIRDNIDLGLDEVEWIRGGLEDLLSTPSQTFDLGEDILANQYRASLLLGHSYEGVARTILSLKVVDYSGPKTSARCHSSDNTRIKVQVYKLYKTVQEKEGLQQAEITSMPHVNFDKQWDELVFKEDIKGELIRIIGNMLRFSQKPGKRPGLNPLLLLYGPPGTGKTTLCQGLAQKISIRLNFTYKRTKLIQIKTATLLSKFYSQSAKQVDEIFTAIEEACQEDPEQFICVLIDEVESIANSRELSMLGEVQDSLRATNALLTGLDRTRKYSNLIFLCTSNIPGCLDAAFLDRCGLKFEVNLPVPAVQYEILRGRMQHLIDDGHIISKFPLPSYRDAQLEFDTDKLLPGSRLLGIVGLINSVNSALSEGKISGRTLNQLPGKAVLRYLEDEECDLEMAFNFMKKSILADKGEYIQKKDAEVGHFSQAENEHTVLQRQRGKATRGSEDDWEVDRVFALIEAMETLVDTVFPGCRGVKRHCGC